MEILNKISNALEQSLGFNEIQQGKLLFTCVVIVLSWLASSLISNFGLERIKDTRAKYNAKKTVGYVFFFMMILIIGRIWFEGFQSITTFLGLVSAGLTIALKDMITDIAGWLFIIWKQPFKVGDRIELGGHIGDVIDFGMFQTTLLEVGNWVNAEQSTGRMILIPNNKIFTESLGNYTKGFEFIWEEIPILVTFESDRKKAKKILETILVKHTKSISEDAEKQIKAASKKFMIFYTYLEPKVYMSLDDSGVMLTLRFLCNPYHRRGLEEQILEDIFEELDKHPDIDFAYPTRRIFDNAQESKQTTLKN